MFAEEASKFNGVVDGPAAFNPIGSGDADEEGQVGGPCGANGVDDLEQQAGAVFKTAAVGIGALVGKRRQELMNQVAVGGVNLDEVKARREGPLRRQGRKRE